MIQEDGRRSPSGERRNKKTMKIQQQRNDARSSASSSSASLSGGARGGSEDDSEVEGEFSPANSGIDPNFLRQIKKTTDLSKLDQEIVRLIGQHLCDVGLRTSADVLMKEAGCRLDQPTAATFRHLVMKVVTNQNTVIIQSELILSHCRVTGQEQSMSWQSWLTIWRTRLPTWR